MGKAVSFACRDWWDKLRRGETPIPALPLDEIEASIAVDLFNKLRVPDVPGQPTFGEVGGEWMRDIVRTAFGTIDPQTGRRLVGEIFNLVPKKNGKTTNAAALGLIAMMMNRTPNVDGVIIGPTQEVAEKCFAQASAMIEADPYLKKRFRIVGHRSTIIDNHVDPETKVRMNAKLKIKSFDPKVVTGSIPAFAILDELHVMAESHYASRVVGQIRGGMITNPESLLIIITTQSETAPQGIFKEELDYARKVRDGEITNGVRMLPVLYEFPAAMQAGPEKAWRDPKNWPFVLPNLGRSIDTERLLALYQQAAEKSPRAEMEWASQHLNIQIGVGIHADGWAGAPFWQAAAMPGLTLETLLARSDVVTIGIDWGGADDLASLSVIGRDKKTRAWLHWSKSWARKIALQRRKDIAEALCGFEKDGDLTICAHGSEAARAAAEICHRIWNSGLLPRENGIGLDTAGVALLLTALEDIGVPSDQMIAVKQGWALQSAVSTVPLMLEELTFRHAGQRIMEFAVTNAKQELKGSNYVVTKQAAGAAKIDPLMSLFNAAMLMFGNPVAAMTGSYLDHAELMVL
jgi:phage terminase large subunit-like protein